MNEWTYVSLLPKFILLFCVFVPPNLIAPSFCCNISNIGSCMASTILCSSFLLAVQFWNDGNSYMPSWHSDVVAWSKMRVVPRSVSDVVATSLFDVVKTLPQRCHNIKHWISRPFYYRLFWFLSLHRNARQLQKC